MVRIDRVVTRGGDGGETSLGDGSRVSKADARVEAIGALDELNAAMGVLRVHVSGRDQVDAMLARIQNDLFDAGADVCVPPSTADTKPRLRMGEAAVLRLEGEIEAMNAALPPLTSFILPGGTPAAAFAHMARVAARRAERRAVAVEMISPAVRQYLNRLSDHLFVLARVLNDAAAAEVLWVPGSSRG